MRTPVLILLLSLVLFSACHKGGQNDPVPELEGTISGTITPNGTGTGAAIVITTTSGQTTGYHAVIESNGNFKIADLPSGNYTLTFTAVAAYTAPASKTVTVVAGQNTDVGTITFTINPGSVSGTVIPANAVSQVWAQDAGGHTYITSVIEPATGSFKITDVPAGLYTISYITSGKYLRPDDKTATVAAGTNTDVGPLTCIPYNYATDYSFKVNGHALSCRIAQASYVATTFRISGGATEGIQERAGYNTYNLIILLDNVTGPGTYLCNSSTSSKLTYTWSAYPSNYGIFTSQTSGASATVVVTALDTSNGTISGTFTATLVTSNGNTSGNQAITEGTFSGPYK